MLHVALHRSIFVATWILMLVFKVMTSTIKKKKKFLSMSLGARVHTYLSSHSGDDFLGHVYCCLVAKSCLTLLQPHGL